MPETLLEKLAGKMSKNIIIKTRRYHLRSYKMCFLGSDAVSWLIASGNAASEAEALLLGARMEKAGLLRHVSGEHPLKNK